MVKQLASDPLLRHGKEFENRKIVRDLISTYEDFCPDASVLAIQMLLLWTWGLDSTELTEAALGEPAPEVFQGCMKAFMAFTAKHKPLHLTERSRSKATENFEVNRKLVNQQNLQPSIVLQERFPIVDKQAGKSNEKHPLQTESTGDKVTRMFDNGTAAS